MRAISICVSSKKRVQRACSIMFFRVVDDGVTRAISDHRFLTSRKIVKSWIFTISPKREREREREYDVHDTILWCAYFSFCYFVHSNQSFCFPSTVEPLCNAKGTSHASFTSFYERLRAHNVEMKRSFLLLIIEIFLVGREN